jgi:erythromycin esterase-like protein
MSKREEIICRHLDQWIDPLPPDDKIILLGHNLHLSKDCTALDAWDHRDEPSIGTYLARKYPGQVCSIWMLYDHGRHLDIYSKPYVKSVHSLPNTIEHLLARVGTVFLLPLHTGDPREAYLAAPRNCVSNGMYTAGAVLSRQADALFFIAQATELRER